MRFSVVRHGAVRGALLAGLAVGLACSDKSSIGPGEVVTVRVVPDTIRLILGKSDTAQAFPLDQDGAFLPGKHVAWTSDNPLVATIAEDGTVTAMGLGMATLTAKVGQVEGTAPVMVSPAPVIAISSDSVFLAAVAQSGAAPSTSVGITNTGGSTLDGLAIASITYSAAATGWLTAGLDQVAAPATLSLDIATTGLALGRYTADVSITDPEASNSPAVVTVVLDMTAGAATTLALAAGNNQTAAVNSTLPIAPAVLITDQFGNPVSGVSVSFAVTGGGGSLTGATPVSDASGIAAVSGWKLGTSVGTNTLTATVAGLTGSPVGFTANATAGAAAQIAVNAGNGQSAIAGQAVSTPPSVIVQDQFGNPVSGVAVVFAVTSGGGSITGPNPGTGPTGIATVGSWTLGTVAGTNTLTATVTGLAGSGVGFTATGTPGAPANLTITAGDNQSAVAGSAVAVAPTVQVTDVNGNGVPNVSVSFAVASGGGSTTGATPTTNGSGVAAVGSWTLGTAVGPNSLDAVVAGVGTRTFAATGLVGPPAILAKNAGDNQAAAAGTPVPVPPAVLVTDQFGNPVSGVGVTFSVSGGGGSITGASQTTNASGIATVGSWTLGAVAGANALDAAATGLTTVTFNATGNPGNAATIASTGGSGQTGTVGSTLPTALSALVTDNLTNPVPGFTVGWAVTQGGGTIDCGSGPVTSCSINTNGSGVTSVTWTVGTTPGAQQVTASAGGLSGSPVTYTATATVGPPANLTKNAGDNQTATVNTAVAVPPAVLVTDQFGNPISGVAVTFAVNGGGGSLTGASQNTNASGIATVGSWTLGTAAGANSLNASVTGLSTVTFNATGLAGAATQMTVNAGNGQSATVNTAVAVDPQVRVADAFNNPVSGVQVTFAPTAGGGSVTGGIQNTNASGLATVTSWTMGTSAGTNNNTLQASATGLSSVNFTASATAGAVATISINAGNGQTATVNTAVAIDPSVLARDAFNNPVPSVAITFTRTSGNGSINCGAGNTTACNVNTNASGIATVTAWTVGTTAGTNNNTMSVTRTGATGTSFTASATAGSVASISINAGNSQTARPGSAVAIDPSVIARDAFSNVVSGAAITFTVTAGGGTIVCSLLAVTSCSVTTNSSGIATLVNWTLSNGGAPSGGTYSNTLSATRTGATSANFSATARYSFALDVQPILTNNGCSSGCHGFAMDTYAGIVNVISSCSSLRYILPGSTGSSFLYQKIISATPTCGVRMPQGGPYLSTTTSNIIRDWINNNAPNN